MSICVCPTQLEHKRAPPSLSINASAGAEPSRVPPRPASPSWTPPHPELWSSQTHRVLTMESCFPITSRGVCIFGLVFRRLPTLGFGSAFGLRAACADHCPVSPAGLRRGHFPFLVHLSVNILPSSQLLKSHLTYTASALPMTVL